MSFKNRCTDNKRTVQSQKNYDMHFKKLIEIDHISLNACLNLAESLTRMLH